MEFRDALAKDGFFKGNACTILKQFCKEKSRLQTFKTYPRGACKSPILLARDGFFYAGSGQNTDDTVVCFSCRKKKVAWREDEDIKDVHQNLCSSCAMVTGTGCGNIPIIAPSVSFEERRASFQGISVKKCTFQKLKLITDKPKRPEYAGLSTRLQTFGKWPNDHHIKKEYLAEAGFYFEEHKSERDCVRCFHCGGTLIKWEPGEDPWVEHARHFPTCDFLKMKLGYGFIETVKQMVAEKQIKISFQMVTNSMGVNPTIFQIDSKATSLKNDPAVMAVRSVGFQEEEILPVAESLKETGCVLTANSLHCAVVDRLSEQPLNINVLNRDRAMDSETVMLENTNKELRRKTSCKLCLDKEVAAVFLPCGHLVCCTECAPNLKNCPVCQTPIQNKVRAFMNFAH